MLCYIILYIIFYITYHNILYYFIILCYIISYHIILYYIYIYISSITSASGPSAMIVPLIYRDRTAYDYLVSRLWFVKALPQDIFTAIDEFLGFHAPLFPRSVRGWIQGLFPKIYEGPHYPERLAAAQQCSKCRPTKQGLKGCSFCLDRWC